MPLKTNLSKSTNEFARVIGKDFKEGQKNQSEFLN